MTADSQTTRWDRSRLGIVVRADVIATTSWMAFHHVTGAALMRLGLLLRRWIPAEIAHNAFLHTLRWQDWDCAMMRFLDAGRQAQSVHRGKAHERP